MQNPEQLQSYKNLVQELLDEAKRQGTSAAEAGLSLDSGLSVTARLREVETIEHHCDQGLGITVYFGQRKGSASTSDLSLASIKETVRAACSIARYTNEDDYAGLPDKAMLATEFPDLDINHPWAMDADQAIDLAIACEGTALDYSNAIHNSEGATLNTHQGLRVMGNSLGFLQGYSSTRHSLSCVVIAGEDGNMQRDYWYSVARDAGQLETATAIGQKAAERTLRRLGASKLTTRQCPVLYAPEMATGLLGSFIGAISGSNLYRKSSFLLDALGTAVFPNFVRLHEQPYLKGGLGSAAFDGDGVATQTRDIVRDGVLQGYVLGTYSARKLGLQSTGNSGGVHNLTLEPGKLDFAGMLKLMDTGLLVTELMGQGVRMVTGDYSRGASGFWVERGEIQYPVHEITIAGNLKTMFKDIVAIGNDMDFRGNVRTGSILIEQMSVAGQ
jgi:PmbA protein